MVSDATVVQVSVSGFQISAGWTAFAMSTPSDREPPPLASTVPSGSSVRLWYARPCAIGAVSRQAGVGAFMSITAVRPWVSYASGPWKSGSAQAPAFMILFGRYMTALCPSNGLVATVDHVHDPGVITRVVRSGPDVEDSAVGEHEEVGVQRRRELAARKARPRVRARVVDLGQGVHRSVGEGRQLAGPVLGDPVAGEDEHAAVGQLRHGGVPAGLGHVGAPEVRLRRGVVERCVVETDVGADVSAGDQRPAVRELHVPGAEQVAGVGNGLEDARCRIPQPLGVDRVVEAVEREDLARRLERHVDGDDRPADRRAPLAVLCRCSDAGTARRDERR